MILSFFFIKKFIVHLPGSIKGCQNTSVSHDTSTIGAHFPGNYMHYHNYGITFEIVSRATPIHRKRMVWTNCIQTF